jgi:predicted PurR-regulated permease PerM
VAFLIWATLASLSDNVLKPIMFGRGVEVPTIVIFLGAIGGMLAMGIIGLFVGAVVLALGYEILMAWLSDEEPAAAGAAGE